MDVTMEQALKDTLPKDLIEKIDEETWTVVRLHDSQYEQDRGLALGPHVMKTVKLLSYPYMAGNLLFAMLLNKESKTFDQILQIALWTGYLVCQDEMRGRAA